MNIKVTEERELELLYEEKDTKFNIEKTIDIIDELIENLNYNDNDKLNKLNVQIDKLLSLNNYLDTIRKMIVCEHDFKNSGFSESKDNYITEIYYCNKCGIKVNYLLVGLEE